MARRKASGRSAPSVSPEPSSPLRLAVLLAPLVAGLAVAALINLAYRSEEAGAPRLEARFWGGAALDPAAAPAPAAVNVACVACALLLWVAAAVAIRRGRPFSEALRLEAWAFVPFVGIILLVALDNYLYPGIVLFSVHAVILAVAGLAAINASLIAAGPRPAKGNMPLAPAAPDAPTGGSRAFAVVLCAAAAYFAAFTAMGFLQYDALNISYTDTADWEQMLYNTLHGRFLMSSAFPHMFFGEHVQFVHLLLLPLYALAPSLKTLMAAKSLWLASAAVPVYLLAVRRLRSRPAAACFAVAYLLYPAMQYTDLELAPNTFRPETAAIPALLWALYCHDAGKMWGLALAAFFAVASKEEFALPVAMIGVLLMLKRRWGWGLAFSLGGAAWFLVSVLCVIPHFRGAASHMTVYYQDFWNVNASGEPVPTGFGGVVVNMLAHPLHTLAVALRPDKVDYLLVLLVPLGLRPLFSWRMLLVAVPSFATTLLASRMPSYYIYWHYQIALVPVLVAGAIYGAENCAGFALARASLWDFADGPARRRAALALLATLVLVSSLAGNVLFAKSPLSLNFYNPNMQTYWRSLYVPDARSRLFFTEVRPLVPDGASVSATEFAATCFARREHDLVFPDGIPDVDYVVVDTRDKWLPDKLSQKQTTVEQALKRGSYELLLDKDDFLVYRKAGSDSARNP